MNAEELEVFVRNGDMSGLLEVWRTLAPEDWRSLSKPAQEIERAIRREDDGDRRWSLRSSEWNRRLASMLACLMFGPKASVMRGEPWAFLGIDAILEVLRARRPEWVAQWLEHQFFSTVETNRLSSEPQADTWPLVRLLIHEGLCPEPDSQGYFGLLAWSDPQYVVGEEPELLEVTIWGLFRHHTVAFHSNDDNERAHDWRGAVVRWAAQGRLDRSAVLDACLSGLMAGIDAKLTLSGFTKLFLDLSPTADELDERQPQLLALLGHDAPQVVAFGVKQLGILHKKELLDAEGFLEKLASVCVLRTKGPVTQCLKITGTLLTDATARIQAALGGLREALVHPAVDVQERAMELLERHGRDLEPHALADMEVGPAIAARFSRWRGEGCSSAAPSEASEVPVSERAPIEPAVRELAVQPMRTLVPPERAASVDALLERVCAQLDADEASDDRAGLGAHMEFVYEGVSRLCDQVPELDDAPRRIAQLDAYRSGTRTESGFVALVLRAWLQRSEPAAPADPGSIPREVGDIDEFMAYFQMRRARAERYGFAGRRAAKLASRVARGQAGPLLSTPTHRDGWVEGVSFVQRVCDLSQRGLDVPMIDLAHALLRVHPSQMTDALAAAEHMPDALAAALKYAAGEDVAPPDSIQDGDLWTRVDRRLRRKNDETLTDLEVLWTSARRARGRSSLAPTVLLEYGEAKPDMRFGQLLHCWFLGEAPETAVGPLVEFAWQIVQRRHLPTSRDDPHAQMLRTFVGRVDTWNPEVHAALGVALFAKDEELRMTAIDLLVDRAEAGRLDPDAFGEVLAELATGDWAPLQRLAAGLRAVADASELCALMVSEALDGIFARLQSLPRGSHTLLELWLEVMVRSGASISEAARERLAGLRPTGKAKTAVGRLTAQVRNPSTLQALHEQLRAARSAAVTTDRPAPEVPDEASWSFERKQWEHGPVDDHGRLHGINRNWTLDGALRSEVAYRHGKQHGEARFFNPDGSVLTEGINVEGEADGAWVYRAPASGGPMVIPRGNFFQRFDAKIMVHVFDRGTPVASFRFGSDGEALDGEEQPVGAPPDGAGADVGFDLVEQRWRSHPALRDLEDRR